MSDTVMEKLNKMDEKLDELLEFEDVPKRKCDDEHKTEKEKTQS